MDWEKLKIFHVVAAAGSFTHAGETLGLSQSAVSRQISALEQELKATLFHRHARGLMLTEQGETLYRTAHDVAVKLGYYDLSTVALDRMDWAACRASDPVLGAVRQYMRALVYFREGEYSIGQRLITSGYGLLKQAEPSRERAAVNGQLHLGASIIAARARDEDAVSAHLAEAKAYADQVGEATEVHWLSFGPTNVTVHAVSANVEMRKYGEALRNASQVVIPKEWAVSRAAHFHVDQARAQMEAGRTEAALKSLLTARRLAPQQTRYHSGARETIRGLIHLQRQTPDTLDHLAAWVGL